MCSFLVMRKGIVLIILGILTIMFGILFHLQGQAIVGPESSFMYSNPEWIQNGQFIAILGVIISVIGFVILKKN